ncbi:MAG TPA: GrpB family protein [Actinomycetota bacterium]|nr:GrpB family protein [Actinomycetota bacterium]
MSLASRGTQPVEVVDYDPDWTRAYAEERDRIGAAIGAAILAIEHVGGTAVPGLPAKPVIDLMVGVEDIERAGPAVAGLINLGYEYVPELESQLPDRRYFRRGSPETHHVHMVPVSSDYWAEHLLFRDYLRGHPQAAEEYGKLKRGLASRHRLDRDAYRAGKVPFIDMVVAAARREAGGQFLEEHP